MVILLATLLLVLIYKQGMAVQPVYYLELSAMLELNYIYLDVNKCVLS